MGRKEWIPSIPCEEDASVKGRFNAWWMAYNLLQIAPAVGGGFRSYLRRSSFFRYAPDHYGSVAPRIAFIFRFSASMVLLGWAYIFYWGFLTWRTGSWVMAAHLKAERILVGFLILATMLQVSLVGFMVGGAFLSLLGFGRIPII